MTFVLGASSLAKLALVRPDLGRVVRRAIELSTVDFLVVEGVRSHEQMCINYGKGRTVEECSEKGIPAQYANPHLAKVTWLAHPLQSKHGLAADGFGHAVDLAPWTGTGIDWNDRSKFQAIDTAMQAAATELGVTITWGGSWSTTPDLPHFEV